MSASSARTPRSQSSTSSTAPAPRGRVIFVGTGPGDPDLLTLGAIAALADASAVILDDDRQREILAHPAITLAEGAEVTTIGLTEARRPLTPSARAKIVLKHASTGARVVRLVTGDPFLDNAVADEAAACVRGGIDFEVVPGVSSLTAVPEYAGIDLIHAGGVQFASVTDGKFGKANTVQWGTAATVVVSTRVSLIGGHGRGGQGRRPARRMIMCSSPCTAAAPSRSPCPPRWTAWSPSVKSVQRAGGRSGARDHGRRRRAAPGAELVRDQAAVRLAGAGAADQGPGRPDGGPAADLRRAQRGGADHLGGAAPQPAADGQGGPRSGRGPLRVGGLHLGERGQGRTREVRGLRAGRPRVLRPQGGGGRRGDCAGPAVVGNRARPGA